MLANSRPREALTTCSGCPTWAESVPSGFPAGEVHLPTLPHGLTDLPRKCRLTPLSEVSLCRAQTSLYISALTVHACGQGPETRQCGPARVLPA